ncbi:MAG: class I SAM-dependent methyltransferase [Alphaproteobacteria bacterium]|nr:class I SAM-dependent methyltransferase [Alphaproteobacteria bacterium]MCB9795305.1 class I SAM-dependent methyltransferase [Alphaproteobacteria bacterium]
MIERLPLLGRLRALVARRVERPESYNALQRAVGSDRVWELMLREHIRPRAGQRILDIGCGPAEVLSFLPEVDYLGIDPHAPYIEGAQARYGARGRFRVLSSSELLAEDPEPYELILLLGVLHHLSDGVADALLADARRLLAPGGRLLTLDGCYAEGQSPVARLLFKADRGRYTRDAEGYAALLRPHFPRIQAERRDDLLRLPYTYLIQEARGAAL